MAKRQFLIAFIGPVGSGKTHIAKILAKKLHAAHIRTDDARVGLRRQGHSYSRAPSIAAHQRDAALAEEKSVIMDFDAILPKRQRELHHVAHRYRTHFFLIRIRIPEKIILRRLRQHRYTSRDLFRNAKEAIRTYFIRKALHKKQPPAKADFVINNARPLAPQIQKIVSRLKGL